MSCDQGTKAVNSWPKPEELVKMAVDLLGIHP
jgi:hypothetical protein